MKKLTSQKSEAIRLLVDGLNQVQWKQLAILRDKPYPVTLWDKIALIKELTNE